MPIVADDASIAAALESADIPTLLAVLVDYWRMTRAPEPSDFVFTRSRRE